MSINQFWEYLTVMGFEGGTVTTCLSHTQFGKVNMDIYDAVRHQQAQPMPQTSSQPRPIGQEPDRSQPMAPVRQISMPSWPPQSHGRCSPSSMCKVPHLAQVYITHSQSSSSQTTGLAHADIGNCVAVDPINASPGVHKTSGDSGSPIGTPSVLDKASCLAPTSSSSPLSPGKAPGLADGINSLSACLSSITGVGDSILILDPNLYSVGIPQSYWDEVQKQFLNVQYEISCISKALNRLCQRESGDITSVLPDMAGDNYPAYNTQLKMSPAKEVSHAEHLDSPGDVQQIGTANADSPSEAVITSGMSSPTEPQFTTMPKPSSIGNVLAKGSVCVPCSPTMQALSHCE